MKLQNKKSGFTLLEIIIVIIIVGVLASLALPRFFSTVEFSRSTEALSNLQTIRSSVERCYLLSNNYNQCNSLAQIDADNPADAINAHFTYTIIATGPTSGFRIVATRNTKEGASIKVANSTVNLVQNNTNQTVTKFGTGDFGGIK